MLTKKEEENPFLAHGARRALSLAARAAGACARREGGATAAGARAFGLLLGLMLGFLLGLLLKLRLLGPARGSAFFTSALHHAS